MTSTNHSRALKAALVLLLTSTSGAAFAQEAETPDSDEIIVTANKRSENLQSVSISVSAVAGDALEKGRTTQIDELVSKVPNLQLTSTVGDNTPNLCAARRIAQRFQPQPVRTCRDLL